MQLTFRTTNTLAMSKKLKGTVFYRLRSQQCYEQHVTTGPEIQIFSEHILAFANDVVIINVFPHMASNDVL